MGGWAGGRVPGSLGRWAAWLLWRGRLAAGRPGRWVAWVLAGVVGPLGVLAVVGGVLAWPRWASGVLGPGLGVAWALGGFLVGLARGSLRGLGAHMYPALWVGFKVPGPWGGRGGPLGCSWVSPEGLGVCGRGFPLFLGPEPGASG